MKKTILYGTLISIMLSSCNQENNMLENKTPLVKVYDQCLYYEDLGDLVPEGTSPEDSAVKVKSYIDIWARKQLMIKKAELNLSTEERNVERQLEDYRASLLIYKYKDKYLGENLDTIIRKEDAEKYYNEHPDDFKLQRNAVKAIYVKVPITSTDINKIKTLLDYRSEKDSLNLYEICLENSAKIENFDNEWQTISIVSDEMPEIIDDNYDKIKAKGTISQNDEQYCYLLKIKDFLPSGSIEPYSMAQNKISSVLLTSRMSALINDLEKTIYDNAINSGNIEYFDNNKK
ncbi:MAG: hypothetical protein MJ211_04425 [Bacteroidales bacterium]|nr:hypothetical protein [Bacteroidales bacterium]